MRVYLAGGANHIREQRFKLFNHGCFNACPCCFCDHQTWLDTKYPCRPSAALSISSVFLSYSLGFPRVLYFLPQNISAQTIDCSEVKDQRRYSLSVKIQPKDDGLTRSILMAMRENDLVKKTSQMK